MCGHTLFVYLFFKQAEDEKQRKKELRQKEINKRRKLETLQKDAEKRAKEFEKKVNFTNGLLLPNFYQMQQTSIFTVTKN